MSKITKRKRLIQELIEPGKLYSVAEAVGILQKCAKNVKFKESVDVAIRLGIDARKENVRGATVMPNGTGQSVKVAVFAEGENAKAAEEAGADIVGMDQLAEQIKKGDFDFQVVIATPNAMRVVGQLGQILGPRGLMPNPKVGTVTNNVAKAVQEAKAGQVRYRTDKNGIVHCAIGKADFSDKAVLENLEALLSDIKKLKPPASKGTYLKKVVLSTTMGPGLSIDLSTLTAA